jgi:hypothetical protein
MAETDVIRTPDQRVRVPIYEHLADRRQELEELTRSGVFDRYMVIELPQREYPAAQSSPDHPGRNLGD